MARRRQAGYIFIPPDTTAQVKITVTRTDGTVDDITSNLFSYSVEDSVTEGIGRFSFFVSNPNKGYDDLWAAMNAFKYYKDYASTATTIRFLGRIEKISYRDNGLFVTGRSESLKLMAVTVTQQYDNQLCGVILKDLITKYGNSEFTTVNVIDTTVTYTANWYQKPFWECVRELCDKGLCDAFVDADADMNYFLVNTRDNSVDGIVQEYNLIEVGDFADDVEQVFNRIIVYGAEVDGVQVLYTADDTTSQTDYTVREEVINNNNITSYTQAEEYGEFILAARKDPPVVGDLTSVTLLATLKPGDRILTHSNTNNLNMAYRKILTYRDRYDDAGYVSVVTVNKNPQALPFVFRNIANVTDDAKKTSTNPSEMRFSYSFTYDSDSGSHTSTEITEGVLKLESPAISGNWQSATRTLSGDITQAYLVINGSKVTGASVEVSGNNGISYDTISSKETITVSAGVKGLQLKIKVSITDVETEINSLSIMYKQ